MKKADFYQRNNFRKEDKELVIDYPNSLGSAFFLCENVWFYGGLKYHLKMKKQVDHLNRDIIAETLYITKKTYITGNIDASATLVVGAETIIAGLVFGKIIQLRKNLVTIV